MTNTGTSSFQSPREELFLALYERVNSRVPAPKLQPWIYQISNIEDKLFAIFLRELCGASFSGKKLYDTIGSWEDAKRLASSNQIDPASGLRQRVGYLGFHGHRKIFHQKYIIGDPKRGVRFHQSSLYNYCRLVAPFSSQEDFYKRRFDSIFPELLRLPGGKRTFAFDLIESVYRYAVPSPSLRPGRLCLEGSTGPLAGFNLLYFGAREFPKREWVNRVISTWGCSKPLWETVESQGERLVTKAEEQTRLKGKSTEYVVFELEDLICNYQKEDELDGRPDIFLKGKLSMDDFATAYLSAFGR